MKIDEAEDAIVKLFLAEWGTRTPVTLDNDQQDGRKAGYAEFVHLSVRENDYVMESIGAPGTRRMRRIGNVLVSVFSKLGEGGALSSGQHAQKVRDILELRRVADDLILTGATPRRVGPIDHWFVTNVEAAFDYEEVK